MYVYVPIVMKIDVHVLTFIACNDQYTNVYMQDIARLKYERIIFDTGV